MSIYPDLGTWEQMALKLKGHQFTLRDRLLVYPDPWDSLDRYDWIPLGGKVRILNFEEYYFGGNTDLTLAILVSSPKRKNGWAFAHDLLSVIDSTFRPVAIRARSFWYDQNELGDVEPEEPLESSIFPERSGFRRLVEGEDEEFLLRFAQALVGRILTTIHTLPLHGSAVDSGNQYPARQPGGELPRGTQIQVLPLEDEDWWGLEMEFRCIGYPGRIFYANPMDVLLCTEHPFRKKIQAWNQASRRRPEPELPLESRNLRARG